MVFDFLREVFEQLVLQTVLLALVVGFHQLQLGNLHIQIHALLDTGVSGTQGLDLGKESAVSSTSSQERTGLLLVIIWLMNFLFVSTVCQR